MIYWRHRQNAPASAARNAVPRNATLWTTLTAWFELNRWCEEVYHPDNRARFEGLRFAYRFEYTDLEGQVKHKTVTLSLDSRELYYHEIPKHFTFHKQKGLNYWDIRKRGHGRVIGRMFHMRSKREEGKVFSSASSFPCQRCHEFPKSTNSSK